MKEERREAERQLRLKAAVMNKQMANKPLIQLIHGDDKEYTGKGLRIIITKEKKAKDIQEPMKEEEEVRDKI